MTARGKLNSCDHFFCFDCIHVRISRETTLRWMSTSWPVENQFHNSLGCFNIIVLGCFNFTLTATKATFTILLISTIMLIFAASANALLYHCTLGVVKNEPDMPKVQRALSAYPVRPLNLVPTCSIFAPNYYPRQVAWY